MKKLIILGTNAASAKYLPSSLRRIGYEPVFILDPRDFAGESRASLETCACYPADIENREEVLRLFAGDPAIAAGAHGITGLYDEKFPLIADLAARYGLHGPDPVIVRLASKAEVYTLIPEYSPPTIRFAATQWDRLNPADIAAAPDGFVLKPAEQSGARGAAALPADVTPEGIRDAIANSGLPVADDQQWVLQANVQGTLISLEGFVDTGGIFFIGFSLRGRIAWTEVSTLFPADDRVPPAIGWHCRAAVAALVRRSGMRQGYFHAEFLMTDQTAYLIDANVGRLAGACVVEQIAMANGLDPEEILGHVVTLGLGGTSRRPLYQPPEQLKPTMSFYYGLEGGGLVKSVSARARADCVHTRVVGDGKWAAPVGTGDSVWVGMLSGFREDAIAEMTGLVIETDDGPRRPAYVVAA